MFITFEGPDGAGKSTALDKLIKFLKDEGIDFVFTREPGSTNSPESQKIRELILDKNSQIDAMTEALLYAADRRLNLLHNIWPALKEGKLVISDRYLDSSIAYQGYARGLGVDEITTIQKIITENTMPDMTIYFDLPIAIAKERRSKRGDGDRLEEAGEEFMEKVFSGYELVNNKYKDRIRLVDASLPEEEVFEQVKKLVMEKIKNV